ncbi:unnamed protein product [Periconia digitata]|uniref:Zn(2)-C6 fungal-type domain-containing protein n=1 Tax=Periconia digitata TaxID=1303443 RepID=A0A9W4XGQ3_9PLEO|nr:unnamed protein product [Periconia digitata]
MADVSAASGHLLPQQQQQPPSRTPGAHRVHSSCDRCRSRKTKCIDPIPGPCRYCARTGSTCQIATPRRKRPYYHVTEEEYQCSMRILEHIFPDRELNLVTLRGIAKDITDGRLVNPLSGQPISVKDEPSPEDEGSPEDSDNPVLDSVNDLHEPLGCMMQDSTGRFRYVGAHSEIPFNAAVCSMGRGVQNPKIIGPPKLGSYPPQTLTPASSADRDSVERFNLPRRELCDFYISRFLEDVHCTHWLYSTEAFLYRVDRTYAGSGEYASNSWICSLYAIFAIGAASYEEPAGRSPLPPGSPAASDERTSTDYIALAKQLIPSAYDEADIDSIRAMAIMSIALENVMSRTSSYLFMGASIQMAYSLGLHRDQIPDTAAAMEHEQSRRIWWTLFNLDQEISSRGGSPSLIDERHLKITTPLPSEQILYPGMHTPLSWLSTSITLCRLKREIIQAVYTERITNSRTISFSTVTNLLISLQGWHSLIPPHLKHDVPIAPSHRRAVAILHLQYWGTTILLCRPFLLYLVLRYSTLDSSKRIWFERMGKACIEAAQKSIAILQKMGEDNILTSLTAFDSTCILRVIMIFILAYAHTKIPQYRSHIETGLAMLRQMEQIGFTKMVTEETPIRVAELGITFDEGKETQPGVVLDDALIAQLWNNFDPNYMTPLQTQQTLDLAFDDANSYDLNSQILQFTSIDDSIVIDPSQAYQQFGYR